jgi:hypothetical protein
MDSPGLTPPVPLTEMVEPRTVPVDHDGGIVEVSNTGCALAFVSALGMVVFAVYVTLAAVLP